MILVGGNVGKINPNVLQKVNAVEEQEGCTATVTLSTINNIIFTCNVVFVNDTTHSTAFMSYNLFVVGYKSLHSSMQDGIMGGWLDETTNWVDAYREAPECPEDLASEVLFDLFVKGWD